MNRTSVRDQTKKFSWCILYFYRCNINISFIRHQEYKSYTIRYVRRNPLFLKTLSRHFFDLRLQYKRILRAFETNAKVIQILASKHTATQNNFSTFSQWQKTKNLHMPLRENKTTQIQLKSRILSFIGSSV